MLELRPDCECCGRELSPQSTEAFICSFECTFCSECVTGILKGCCPNCQGERVRRPLRPDAALLKYPAATRRYYSAKPTVSEE